ncbi:nucleotidyl transferase AbiEii/AbiGii toxin family protein [Flagellimonas meridianipacifica]|uniref:Nucleotidyltransferase AbiEii toxin of type IV toxin-antitoxin system n=1 Tax=Flagellimonas meridianipacifica TaxID=1080225 RepID=A0A2T0MIZ0_9FLAO|nr:nucleotidyl transferase AbiEii/AbiGii toxin family protein [Allomuricauda pacifica]PRX57523.1 nucleotidyltransferase AbiEii toxin of type IV toxin-antitoxin system [Allomuricauda pacifica]
MIQKDSLKEEWIKDIAKRHKSDPILVEKVVRALYLLEQLQNSELDFIFKGGTALMLLLPEPKRFSIDIDIIVSKKPIKIEDTFDSIIEKSDFLEYKEDKRKSKSSIEKAHYKFYYKPVTSALTEKEYILLDILYEDSHYADYLKEIEIVSSFIRSEGKNTSVTVPISEAILGDKLTAFAPNTTGVPYGLEKEVEIIKQLFDVGHLFDMVEKIEAVSAVFEEFAKTELAYRDFKDVGSEEVLKDILETAMVIATRGKSGHGDFEELQRGIQNIKNYIFSENFHLERAMVPAAKAAYISAILQTNNKKVHRFSNPIEVEEWVIEQPFETRLNKLKKSNAEAFFYWYKAFELLKDKT